MFDMNAGDVFMKMNQGGRFAGNGVDPNFVVF
jgi:hypothetical protein